MVLLQIDVARGTNQVGTGRLVGITNWRNNLKRLNCNISGTSKSIIMLLGNALPIIYYKNPTGAGIYMDGVNFEKVLIIVQIDL